MKTFEEKMNELKGINPWEMSERDRKELLIAALQEAYPEVVEDMRTTLKYYDGVYLSYENGRYEVSIGLTLKSSYAKDYVFHGEFDRSFFDYDEKELQIAREELAQCQWF